jgi:uridine phosphorylase
MIMEEDIPPIRRTKRYDEPSVFQVEGLLREARRQRGLGDRSVPEVCLLDPDGDVVRHLSRSGHAVRHEDWACYHSELWVTKWAGREFGIVPCAVGGPYAVLVASELHASGCELVVSVTSAGRILPLGDPPYFVLIERAWRDEGTSQHYLPPSEWVTLKPELAESLAGAFEEFEEPVLVGRSWTTDAPFRETATSIAEAEAAGVHAVEMEAAGLYAYAMATGNDVVCVAHVTNTMAVDGDDFEKGENDGTHRILALLEAITRAIVEPDHPMQSGSRTEQG